MHSGFLGFALAVVGASFEARLGHDDEDSDGEFNPDIRDAFTQIYTTNKWLECAKKLYAQLMGEAFPGEDQLTEKSAKYTAYSRKAIDRCWKTIRKAAKGAKAAPAAAEPPQAAAGCNTAGTRSMAQHCSHAGLDRPQRHNLATQLV